MNSNELTHLTMLDIVSVGKRTNAQIPAEYPKLKNKSTGRSVQPYLLAVHVVQVNHTSDIFSDLVELVEQILDPYKNPSRSDQT